MMTKNKMRQYSIFISGFLLRRTPYMFLMEKTRDFADDLITFRYYTNHYHWDNMKVVNVECSYCTTCQQDSFCEWAIYVRKLQIQWRCSKCKRYMFEL